MTTGDTLTDEAVDNLGRWIVEQGVGSRLVDVQPLTGGTQNIVVRLVIRSGADDVTLVLRRPGAPRSR